MASFAVKAVAIGSITAIVAAVNRIEKETHPMVVELVVADWEEEVAFTECWVGFQAPVEELW